MYILMQIFFPFRSGSLYKAGIFMMGKVKLTPYSALQRYQLEGRYQPFYLTFYLFISQYYHVDTYVRTTNECFMST
jgi:hypothetical protein